jgi:hypothetical protein
MAGGGKSLGFETVPSLYGTNTDSRGLRDSWVTEVTRRTTWGGKPTEASNSEGIAPCPCCPVTSAAACNDHLRGFQVSGSGDTGMGHIALLRPLSGSNLFFLTCPAGCTCGYPWSSPSAMPTFPVREAGVKSSAPALEEIGTDKQR